MAHTTLKTELIDRLHTQASDRETRFIAAQEAGRILTEKIAGVLSGYDFSREEFNTLYANGICTQAAMKVVCKTDASLSYLVICKMVDGQQEWNAYCPRGHKGTGDGQLMIAAVQARIAANRAGRMVN